MRLSSRISMLPLLSIFSLPVFCEDAPETAVYGAFVFPPPGFCFPESRSVYLSSSVSDALFAADPPVARTRGLEVEFLINGQTAAIVPWSPEGGFDADEGLSHRLALPGLSDGAYSASMVLRFGAAKNESGHDDIVGAEAETHFSVDSAGGCRGYNEEVEVGGTGEDNVCIDADMDKHSGGPLHAEEVGQRRVLSNAAAGAASWQSSTYEGHPASLANDGEIMVSSRVNGFAQTVGEPGRHAWWEVDLGRDLDISHIDIWGGRRANGVGMYPPVVGGAHALGPFDVQIHSTAWQLVSQRRFQPSAGSIFSWPEVAARGRYVRIRLVAIGVVLKLREVSVWAWRMWHCPSQCLHGVCSAAGECRCEADFMGPHCERNLLTDDSFLPPPTWLAHIQTGFKQRSRQADEFDAALQAVQRMQRPASCTSTDAMVMGFHSGGLAATISLVTGLHSLAFSLGKALLLWRRSDWFYADAKECPSRQLDCYFEAWHNCSAQHVETFAEGALHLQAEETSEARGVQIFAHVPKQFESQGLFWWRSVLSEYIFRPLPWFQHDIGADLIAQQIGLEQEGKGYIGLHFRAGDSCVKWQRDFGGDCIGLEHHLAYVRLIAARYQLTDVFVATDDPTAIDRLQRSEEEEGGGLRFVGVERFRDLLLEMEQSKHQWTEDRLRRGHVPSGPLLRSTVADIILLSRASAFVLHFASNLSRLAYQLSYAHSRTHLPFVSVDGAWCYHWQMCCDVDRIGRSHMCS